MNRRAGDPVSSDYSGERSLCEEHRDRLHKLEVAVTGNGGDMTQREASLVWQVKLLVERQKPLYDFINDIKKIFWIIVPICVAGAVSALWQGIRALVVMGKI
jgi:hypothetical protein